MSVFPSQTNFVTGDILTATAVNEIGQAINLLDGAQFAAGKNKIINGDFSINQRAFTSNTTHATYNFDRWLQQNGGTSGTLTVTPQTFTPGAAPVAGYEGKNFLQGITAAGANTDTFAFYTQRIEDVRTLAGQTATISFFAKAASGTPKIALEIAQNFGQGGSPSTQVLTTISAVTISTSWARYSVTVNVPSISGKTLGTTPNTSILGLNLWLSAGSDFNARASSIGLQNNTFQIWGVQFEAANTASNFQTASGTLQGELALCQRYFYSVPNGNTKIIGASFAYSTTEADMVLQFPVQMRTTPSYSQIGGANYFRYFRAGGTDDFDGLTLAGESTAACAWLYNNTNISGTAGQAGLFQFNNALTQMLFSAEL
jgi:hypothetical protein